MADDAIRGLLPLNHFDPDQVASPTAFISHLVNDLRWLDTLAQNWSTPYQNEVLEGTDTWYLVAYVEMMSKGAEFFRRVQPHRSSPQRSGALRDALTGLLNAYTAQNAARRSVDVDDLISTRHKICRYERLQSRLQSCLRAITNRPLTD